MRRSTLIGIVVAITTALSGAANAAPTTAGTKPVAPEAREDYERARAQFQRGDYAGCVQSLARAEKLAPDPRFLWNAAACEKKLGHYAKAIATVERYLAASGTSLTEQEKKEATQFLDAARAYVARVTITANVDGASVFVDGELVGTTPFAKPISVDEGEHTVRYVRSGYEPAETKEKALAGAELRWAIDLTATSPSGKTEEKPTNHTPATTTTTTTTTTPSKQPTRVPIGPIVVGGVGIVVAGIGAGLLASTLSEASTIEDECGTACPRSRWEPYRDKQVVADVMLIGGAVALTAGIVWWLLQRPNEGPSRTANVHGATWRF